MKNLCKVCGVDKIEHLQAHEFVLDLEDLLKEPPQESDYQ